MKTWVRYALIALVVFAAYSVVREHADAALVTDCKTDTECANNSDGTTICYGQTNKCVKPKSLATGSNCSRVGVCTNECDWTKSPHQCT